MSIGLGDWDKPCYHIPAVFPADRFILNSVQELAIHEWDIRSKLDVSTKLSSLCLPAVMDFIAAFVVGTMFRPGIDQTETVRFRFELTGAVPGSRDIVAENGNVYMESARATTANVTIRCDTETFALLVYGRTSLAQAESGGRLTVEGDRELASLISG